MYNWCNGHGYGSMPGIRKRILPLQKQSSQRIRRRIQRTIKVLTRVLLPNPKRKRRQMQLRNRIPPKRIRKRQRILIKKTAQIKKILQKRRPRRRILPKRILRRRAQRIITVHKIPKKQFSNKRQKE